MLNRRRINTKTLLKPSSLGSLFKIRTVTAFTFTTLFLGDTSMAPVVTDMDGMQTS